MSYRLEPGQVWRSKLTRRGYRRLVEVDPVVPDAKRHPMVVFEDEVPGRVCCRRDAFEKWIWRVEAKLDED